MPNAYQRSMRQSSSMSNNFIAALLVIPLGLIGIRIGLCAGSPQFQPAARILRFAAPRSAFSILMLLRLACRLVTVLCRRAMREQDLKERTGRLNGLLHPPVNEWIADDGAAGGKAAGGGASGSTTGGLLQNKVSLQPGDGRRIMQRGVAERIMGRFTGTWGNSSSPPAGGGEAGAGQHAGPTSELGR